MRAHIKFSQNIIHEHQPFMDLIEACVYNDEVTEYHKKGIKKLLSTEFKTTLDLQDLHYESRSSKSEITYQKKQDRIADFYLRYTLAYAEMVMADRKDLLFFDQQGQSYLYSEYLCGFDYYELPIDIEEKFQEVQFDVVNRLYKSALQAHYASAFLEQLDQQKEVRNLQRPVNPAKRPRKP